MPLDPQAQAYLERQAAANVPPKREVGPEKLRQQARTQATYLSSAPVPVGHIENIEIPGPNGPVPVRIYTPDGSGPFPVLVYIHGGGWVNCDLDTHDTVCRGLTNGADCMVAAVDYRQAPENKFPVGLEDSYAALEWLAANAARLNGDPSRLAVGGDSSGGNFAAELAQMARDRGGPKLALQVLIYPNIDLRLDAPSIERNGKNYGLTKEDLEWYREQYINSEEDILNPLASPGLAADLSGLPPAFILTVEYDPLIDEAEIYAKQLTEAGVPVKLSRYDGMIHGFIRMTALIDRSHQAIAECSQALKEAFQAGEKV